MPKLTLLFMPLLPATGDSLRPLIFALVIFVVALAAALAYMFLRRKGK